MIEYTAYRVDDKLRPRLSDQFHGVEHVSLILTTNEIDHVQQGAEQTTSLRAVPNQGTTTLTST